MFFIIYFIPDFIILRFFMYLIDMRNHAKEKNLRILLGWLLMFWREKSIFDISVFQTQLVLRGPSNARPWQRLSFQATNPIEKLSRRNNRSNLLKCLRTDPFLVSKNYKLIRSLKKHLEKNHAILNAILFKCETCGKTFATKCQETRHMKSHWFLSPSSNRCHLNEINI